MRLLHLYIGVFTAPALLFFAFTGALQTFSLHETSAGSSYKPPAWAVTLGQIHKKQTPIVPPRRQAPPRPAPELYNSPAPSPAAAATVPASQPPARTHNPLPLKIFFLIVAIGLCLSTLTGVYMSWKYTRNRTVIVALLLAGIIIPVGMILV
jgi:hypothetical protein